MKVAIAGASGFIGTCLQNFLREKNYEVNPLKRGHFYNVDADVIINLAGENIFGRWSEEKKRRILKSRLETTEALCQNCPKLFINASAVGYYGNRGDEKLTEESHSGSGFLAGVCREWEEACKPPCRVVLARFGMVLSPKGGALRKMLPLFKLSMAGKLGSGNQIWSWIALEDLLSAIDFVIRNQEINGPVNFTAPEPISNKDFTKTIAAVLQRPAVVHVPSFVLKVILGEAAIELFLASQRAYPEKLLQKGFHFRYCRLKDFLEDHL